MVKKGLKNRDKVLAAARDLFSCNGFHQAGMAELAKASGLGVGQIYRIFENKNEIILAIAKGEMDIRQDVAVRMLALLKNAERPVEHVLEQFIKDWFGSQDDRLAFDILAEAQRNAFVADAVHRNGPDFRRVLRAAVTLINPDLKGVYLDGAEEFLFATLFGMGHRNLTDPSISIEDIAKISARMIVNGIRSLSSAPAEGPVQTLPRKAVAGPATRRARRAKN